MYFLKFNIAILAGGSISSLASNKQMQIFFFFFKEKKYINHNAFWECKICPVENMDKE